VSEERFDLLFGHFGPALDTMEQHESSEPHLMYVVSSGAVVGEAQRVAQPIQQPRCAAKNR